MPIFCNKSAWAKILSVISKWYFYIVTISTEDWVFLGLVNFHINPWNSGFMDEIQCWKRCPRRFEEGCLLKLKHRKFRFFDKKIFIQVKYKFANFKSDFKRKMPKKSCEPKWLVKNSIQDPLIKKNPMLWLLKYLIWIRHKN